MGAYLLGLVVKYLGVRGGSSFVLDQLKLVEGCDVDARLGWEVRDCYRLLLLMFGFLFIECLC